MRWRPRRWRPWLLGAAGLLLVVRAALPSVLRWQIETRGSAALVDSRLTVGDVDLALWKGEVALDDVALVLPAPPGAAGRQRPFVAWHRLVVGLRWWPLVHKRVQLWLLELDGPKVALARRLDGTLQLPVPAPSSEPPPPPEPPAEGPGWSFGVDQIVLKHGGLQFSDATLGGDEDPVEIGLDNVQVRDLAFTPDVYGGPSRLALDLRIDRGRIRLDAWGGLTPDGPEVRALLRAVRLPVHRTRRYVPGVGWSGLWGDVGLGVSYVHVPGARDEVRGVALARNVTVWVEKLEEPALAWEQLAVRLDRVDLRDQLAAVREVVLSGASVVVQPRAQPPLPVMALAAAEAAPAAPPAPAPDAAAPADDGATSTTTTAPPITTTTTVAPAEGAAAAPAQPAAPAKPWRWRVEQVRLPDTTVRVRGPFDPLDVGVKLVVSKLAGPEAAQAGVDLGLQVREASVAAQGTLHLPKPGWDGTLKIDGLVLPPLLAIAGGPAATMLGDGRLGLDLAVAAIPPATDVIVRGGVTLDGLAVNAGDGIPAATLTTLALRDADVLVPGALAGAPSGTARVRLGELALGGVKATAPDGKAWFAGLGTVSLRGADVSVPLPSDAGGATTVRFTGLDLADVWATGDDPKVFGAAVGRTTVRDTDVALAPGAGPRVHVGGVQLEAPFVRLTRTETGMALPGAAPAPAPAPAETAPAATPAPAPPAPPAPAAPPAAGAPLQLALDDLRITRGSVGFTDRTVKPFYSGWIDPLTVDVDRLRMPGPEIARLKVHAGTPRGGTIDLDGNMGRRGSQVDLTVRDLALAPFNPYATAYSNYSISRGALNVTTRGKFEGPAYDTDTNILLSDFDLASRGGDTLFTEQLGVPLTVALALMRDVQGDIVLDVPVAGDEKGTSVAIGSIALGALRRALVNALASPLKLAGMLVPGGSERLDSLVPKPVPFLVGRATVAPGAEEQLSQLAALLASRPAMAVVLTAAPTDADVRWIAEQDLRAELEKPRGVLAAIGGLSERGTRNRIIAALQARADGQPGELDAEDAATLDRWLAERGPVPPERVQALATDRVAAVEKILEEQYGVAGDRVTRGEAPTAPGDAPTVALGLGAVAR